MQLSYNNKTIELSHKKPLIMGILNVTPDSFSDGGLFNTKEKALEHVKQMIKDGADIIDIGAESTRPFADPVSEEEELNRICEVLDKITQNFDIAISIDTSSPKVIKECVKLGAFMWNDIRALNKENAIQTAVDLQIPVCIMHMQGDPKTMQVNPVYQNVVQEVYDYLVNRAKFLETCGIKREHIILDVGFGFGKSVDDNYKILKNLEIYNNLPYFSLTGLSRKRMIGEATGISKAQDRMVGSVVAAIICAQKGSAILRVHDVKETKEALNVWQRCL